MIYVIADYILAIRMANLHEKKKVYKKFASSGIRTYALIRGLELESNALTNSAIDALLWIQIIIKIFIGILLYIVLYAVFILYIPFHRFCCVFHTFGIRICGYSIANSMFWKQAGG